MARPRSAATETRPTETRPSPEDMARFELLLPLVAAAHQELRELSKKGPREPLNPLKVSILNKLLTDVRASMKDDPSLAYLQILDEALIPLNSDAVLILGQYMAAMDHFRARHERKGNMFGF